MRHWLQTALGAFDLETGDAWRSPPGGGHLVPHTRTTILDELGVSLGHLCRFTGHTSRLYSVAEHCLMVEASMVAAGLPVETRLAGLLHDAHEAYLGDIATPIASALADLEPGFRTALTYMKRKIDGGILRALRLPDDLLYKHAAVVTEHDLMALHDERVAFLPPEPAPWRVPGGPTGRKIPRAPFAGVSNTWRRTALHLIEHLERP